MAKDKRETDTIKTHQVTGNTSASNEEKKTGKVKQNTKCTGQRLPK